MSYVRNTIGNAEIIDRNHYYAFGMNHLSRSGGTSVYDPLAGTYKYKYNGKELQETGMYDYGWRMYMPNIARWNGIDQLAEKYGSFSPYAYVMNNPVMFFDPDGRDMGMPDWLQKLWNKTETYSYWTSNGYGGFNGGEIGMSQTEYTNFYNFLAGGGTGTYTYWVNGNSGSNGYSLGMDGLRQRDIQESIGITINISNYNFNSNHQESLDQPDSNGFGLGLSMFSFGAGTYSDYIHNHKTYTTTAGRTKNIYKANGAVRSARAAQFANTSKFVKGLGVAGAVASTAYSGYKVANQIDEGGIKNINALDATDTIVGSVGISSTILVSAGLISNPVGWVIGAGVTLYFGGRLVYDLINE